MIRNAARQISLKNENEALKNKVVSLENIEDIVGNSRAMMKVLKEVENVAQTNSSVIITGESGTGKELIARAIHSNSPRKFFPLVTVHCGALPEDLLESELFGHEKGAFTSAVKQHIGKFEQANGGTLFLDEIGDMSLSAQAKVLRVLQESIISRVGGDKHIKVDVRVVAATNKNLSAEIAENNFREDLYHRLSVILIRVPALNERLDDIPLLANHFIQLICDEYGMPKKTITDDAIAELQTISWTGNIREFRNVIERLIILCDQQITGEDVLRFAAPLK
jgi:transcriptional regulator with GAF, ATPase, and Fis domain